MFIVTILSSQLGIALMYLATHFLFYTVSSLTIPLLQKKLSEFKIPDMSGDTRTKLGRIKYTISKYVCIAIII